MKPRGRVRRCRTCASSWPLTARFCGRCGVPLRASTGAPRKAPGRRAPRRAASVGAALIAVLVASLLVRGGARDPGALVGDRVDAATTVDVAVAPARPSPRPALGPVAARCDERGIAETVCVRWSVNVASGTFADGMLADGRLVVLDVAADVLMGVDAQSGRIVWLHGTEDGDRLGAVVGGFAVLVGLDGSLRAHDLATGDERWRAPLDDAQPVVGATKGAVLLAGGDRLTAVSAADGRALWRRAIPGMVPWVLDNGVWLRGDGVIVALDAGTGADQWRAAVSSRQGVTATGDVVVSGDADGRLVALDAATGRTRWTTDPLVPGFVNGLDAIDPMGAERGAVLVRHRDTLFAIEELDGRLRWRTEIDRLAGSPLGAILVAGPAVGALDPRATPPGAERRRTPLRRAPGGAVSRGDHVLVVAHDPVGPPVLVGVTAGSGRPAWRFDTWPARRLVPPSTPAVGEGEPVIVTVPGAVVALDVTH